MGLTSNVVPTEKIRAEIKALSAEAENSSHQRAVQLDKRINRLEKKLDKLEAEILALWD
jgi:polyhydroxyalkanoate synthesis regulator phasin